MRTILKLNPTCLLSYLFLISILNSCGSYQGVSYYASDGIYGGELTAKKTPAQVKTNQKSIYYKDYFSNIADDYSSLNNTQDYVFTDTENYSSNRGNKNVKVNSQAPWGDHTSRTEVYYINNNPWGYFNFNWGFYGGFYNSFYDPFWGFSPFYNRGLIYPNWGLGFYDPFFYRGGINFGYRFNRYNFLTRHSLLNRFYRYGNNRGYAHSGYSRGFNGYSNRATNSRGSRARQINNQTNSSYRANNNSRVSSNNNGSIVNRYNVGRSSQNDRSNQGVTRNASPQSNQSSTYRNSPQSNPKSYSNNSTRSNRSNYNSGRSYSPSRSYSSSNGRSSSYSSGSRGSSSGSKSSSRGR